ncbi:arabinose efflux permease family protein [Natrinema pellirubrum DSM 15624]|uniref:Arabinose efflux permease family protein n=1 Tax=Natrinema pellirubrum (strain DSM 15624 / CIP 106293 / JCM 10476 / NCIMB 786 / 157) TaxID=797303 RepID=L0JM19_NATP1|nr:MFS transporter [Natrinema pellirubrum]AGB32294.1 arabinose efflux permease family protein [Natrinema pellirubrum DSM 15624]
MNLPSSGSNRVVYAVVASTFFVGFGGGVVFPILPNLGEVLGISAFMVGVILSANRWTRLVANGPAGALVDRIGTRKPFVAGLAIEGAATAGYVVAITSSVPEFWFVLARVCWGVGSALVFATAYTITADVSDAGSRGESMGIVRAGITFGFPAGMVLGGIVSEVYSNATAFVLAACFAGLASIIAYFIVPETHVDSPDTSIKPWDLETTLPALTVGLVNFGLYFAYFGVLFSTLVLYLDAESTVLTLEFAGVGLEYGEQGTSGLLMAVSALSGALFTILGGKISDTVGARVPVLLVFLVTSCLGFAVLTLAPSLSIVVGACALIGAGQGGVGGPLTALLADLTPEDRMGRAMGTNNVFGDVGGAVGPLLSLPFAEAIGFDVLYALSATIPLLAGATLVVGIYTYTGSLSPTVEESIV